MILNNCDNCGRLYIKKLDNYCSACVKIRYTEIQQIKGWIAATKVPHLQNIERETGVTPERFKHYLQEGRIKTYDKVRGNCERCNLDTIVKTRTILCKNCQEIIKNPKKYVDAKFRTRHE